MSKRIVVRGGSSAVREKNAYYGHSRTFIDNLLAEDNPVWVKAQESVRELVQGMDDEEMLLEMLGLKKAA